MSFLSKGNNHKKFRLFYATDIHGSERTFRKFVNAGKFYEADALIMGGDITGKMLIPIISEGNGNHRATLQGQTEHLTTHAELESLTQRLGTLGLYHKTMGQDEFQTLSADPAAVRSLFNELARQRLVSWVELAETRLAGTGIKCFVTGGNDDDPEVLQAIHRDDTQSFFACEGKVAYIDDEHHESASASARRRRGSAPEVSDEELRVMIDKMMADVRIHAPRSSSTIRRPIRPWTCPELDWTTDPPRRSSRLGRS
jgi:Icc-related predicted phosphoesterase